MHTPLVCSLARSIVNTHDFLPFAVDTISPRSIEHHRIDGQPVARPRGEVERILPPTECITSQETRSRDTIWLSRRKEKEREQEREQENKNTNENERASIKSISLLAASRIARENYNRVLRRSVVIGGKFAALFLSEFCNASNTREFASRQFSG